MSADRGGTTPEAASDVSSVALTGAPPIEAAYLHARSPADARIAVWHAEGRAVALAALPAALRARVEPVDLQLLLPVEESTLRPMAAESGDDEDERQGQRIAPALWTIPAHGLRLQDAVPWLGGLDARALPPRARVLALASRLCLRLRARGSFAPAPQPGVARFAPHWDKDAQ